MGREIEHEFPGELRLNITAHRTDDDKGVERHRVRAGDPDIALAILGSDETGRAGIVAQPLAQPVDEKVDIANAGAATRSAQHHGKFLARNNGARTSCQFKKKNAFLPRKRNLAAIRLMNTAHGRIEGQTIVRQHPSPTAVDNHVFGAYWPERRSTTKQTIFV